ncbi:MAG TPA: hypothetical protein VMO20_07390 [Candidatus Acidoferrum sp.]|nr:hypothetical protein [Candidatus Acidoferrum sp.]
MSHHINRRIASLRELIKGGLHQENLDKMVAECNALSQDTSFVLPFFVLKNVFNELSSALDRGAVAVEQHQDLISNITESAILILNKIEKNELVEIEILESIARDHVRNINIFRSDR